MKKLALTLAIILGIALGASAQNGGLFGKGPSRDMDYEYGTREGEGPMINLPGSHGTTNDESAPLGGGIALLTGLGAAYLVAKKRKNAQRGAMMALLALLAFGPTAWAQNNWDEVYAMTQTTSGDWTAINSGSTSGHTLGSTGNTTYYYVNSNLSFTNSNVGGSGIKIQGTVYLYVPEGVTLTCTGANANAPTGAGAGIELASGNTLYLLGGGTINATGGNAANGGTGGTGDHSYFVYDSYCQPGSGGNGGNGGGGAGAGIGTRGGNGGSGGSGATAKRDENEGTNHGVAGSAGSAGTTAGGMGTLYVVTSFVNLNASGGAAGSNGSGGARGNNAAEDPYNQYAASGGGGGGAGGFGGAASNIGTGGPGGGGGGGGAAGNSTWRANATNGFYRVGAGGGSGGYNCDGSQAANGVTSLLTNPYNAEYNQGLSGDYDDDGWEEGNGMYSGGSGASAGSASTSGSANNVLGTDADGSYLIYSAADWNTFAAQVANGNTYSGKTLKLMADISVSAMVGGNNNSFQGTFDGDGHTLTFTGGRPSTHFNEQYCAPFRYTKGTTIQHLRVTGKIYISQKFGAGLIAYNVGTTNITDCHVSTNIFSSVSGEGTHGGFVARTNGTLNFTGCVYTGRMMTNGSNGPTTDCGGFVGWGDNQTTISVSNSLYAPGSIPQGWSTVINNNCATFMRGNGTPIITNSYYTMTMGTAQGKLARTITPGEYVTVANTSNATEYIASGITSDGTGIKYDDVFYASNGDNVSLMLGSSRTGYIASGYQTSDGTLSGLVNPYTLAMPNGNVTISAIAWIQELQPNGNNYSVNNANEWESFCLMVANDNDFSGKTVTLTDDISVTMKCGIVSVNTQVKAFSGTFDGGGHTITATITDNRNQGSALFCNINGATIRDLTVAGTITSEKYHTSGLVGFAGGTNLIEDCDVTATLNIKTDYAGGIVGHGLESNTTIRGCVFAGTINGVDGSRNNIGGIWGWSNSATPTLENCIEMGTYNNIGSMHPMGLQGSTGTITNCYYVNQQIGSPANACTVEGASMVYASFNEGEIYKVFTVKGHSVYSASCTVSGVSESYHLSSNVISITPVVTDPYDSELAFGTDYTATLNGAAIAELPINISEMGEYTLTITGVGNYTGVKDINFEVTLGGEGTEEQPYLISSENHWNEFVNQVNRGNTYSGKYVKLTADINISQTVGLRDNKPFSGTFLGNGNTITASINSTTTGTGANEQGVAPFHYINGATIKDLKVAGTIASASYHTSGLVGFANGTNTIENCLVTATLNISSSYAGGIIGHGQSSNTTIRGCVFAGTFNGVGDGRENIGGIWGWSNSGTPTLEDCLEAGTYTNIASMHPMGLQKAAGTITGCYYVNPQVGSPANVCTVSGAAPGNARMIAGYGEGNDKWAFIASPLTANTDPTTVQNLISASEYDLYQLNPGTMMWENYKQHEGNAASGFSLENGRGYLYATQSEQAIKFSGANASAYNLDNTKEVTLQQGFNLVGNPFPRAAYINRSYYTLNSDGSAVSTTPSTEYIPPCHAVVVEATNSESLTFSTKPLAQQSTGNNGGLQIALSQTVATRGGAEAKTIDNAIVSFNEGMELGKFYFGTQDANVYIPQDGKDYAIVSVAGRDGACTVSTEIPVNFKAKENGTYTLTVNHEVVEMAYLHLIDNITGNDVDLLTQPSYTFTARNDDYESRFRLVFVANNADLGGEGNDDFAFISNGQLIVTGEGTLQVVDMMGRVISTEVVNGTSSKAINAKAGVYVLRLINGENVKTQKIVVR